MRKKNEAIIIIGPPRSGTSITAAIIQDILGEKFPFEVNRHNEPEKAVKITRNFLKRKDFPFSSRFNFGPKVGDQKLKKRMENFLNKYKNKKCVIKEPIWTIFYAAFPEVVREASCKILFVDRRHRDKIKSLMHHKKMSKEEATESVLWYNMNKNYLVNRFSAPSLTWGDAKEYKRSLKLALPKLGLGFDEEIFDKHFDSSKIKYYESS